MVIFDFTGVYREQDFYQEFPCEWKDFTDLSGVNGFCDEAALSVLRERTGDSSGGIHLLDGGNYHYMSYVMAEKVKEPFCLVVIDHHTDMKPSMFEELLSCGCWVKRVLDDNPMVKNVVLIGVADWLADSVGEEYRDVVTVYPEGEVMAGTEWLEDMKTHMKNPVYLSVDKDAFGTETAVTDWDQGSMNLEQMRQIYEVIRENERILGIDICGEYTDGGGSQGERPDALLINSRTNRELIRMFGEL